MKIGFRRVPLLDVNRPVTYDLEDMRLVFSENGLGCHQARKDPGFSKISPSGTIEMAKYASHHRRD